MKARPRGFIYDPGNAILPGRVNGILLALHLRLLFVVCGTSKDVAKEVRVRGNKYN